MKTDKFLTVAMLGTLWGFLEATLGGALHMTYAPFTGTIMSSIGLTILFAGSRRGLKAHHLAYISLIAASFKFLDIWLFSLPLLDQKVINPATAIASLGLAASFVIRPNTLKLRNMSARFFASAAIGVIAFNTISVFLYGWQTFHTLSPLKTALVVVPAMAILASVFSKILIMAEERLPFQTPAFLKTAFSISFIAFAILARSSL